MDIITTIFNWLIGIIFFIMKLVIAPIDALITAALPSLSDAFTAVGAFLVIIANSIGWAISASGIPYAAVALIGVYVIFKLTLPFNVWLIKLAISWYKALKV